MTQYLDFAEIQALQQIPMKMVEWINDRAIKELIQKENSLPTKGEPDNSCKVTKKACKKKAILED